MSTLAERIHIIYQETGKPFAELGKIAGVTKSASQQWKDGTTKSIKAEAALRLEDALGYSSRWIINGTEPKMLTDWMRLNSPYSHDVKAIADLVESLDPGRRKAVQDSAEIQKQIQDLTAAQYKVEKKAG